MVNCSTASILFIFVSGSITGGLDKITDRGHDVDNKVWLEMIMHWTIELLDESIPLLEATRYKPMHRPIMIMYIRLWFNPFIADGLFCFADHDAKWYYICWLRELMCGDSIKLIIINHIWESEYFMCCDRSYDRFRSPSKIDTHTHVDMKANSSFDSGRV